MGDTSALSPPSPSALSYFDALQQVSSFDKVNLRGLTPLPLGWGLTTSEFRPPHVIIHDGGMIEQLLQNLRTTLQGIDGPTPSSLASVELDVWGRCMLDNSAWERRSMSLCRATTNVTNNISELLLNRAILDSNDVSVPSLSPAPSPPCTFRSLQGSEHHRWSHYEDTQELTSTKTGLILHVKSVTDTKLLDTALPYLLDFGKDQVIVTGLGQRIPAPNPFGVLQLIAHHFGASSATWLVLTSSIHSMILRLYQAHNGERIILCSDLIHMKQSHLLLPALISLQLSPINNKLDVHLPLGPKFEPLRVIQDRKNRRLEVENSDAIVLGFAPEGSSVVHERYVLSRHKDGVAVKRPDSLDNVTLASLPLLVITEKIGSGTCGTVYLATARGKQQIAVKIAMVAAGNTHCLAEELAAYECVRRVGLEGKATPRCFGLFSSKDMAVLLTAYSGQALASFELPIEDKLSIFRTVKSLEDAGIEQGSFYPRNVVRDDNGVFRIIDFHRGTYEKGRTIDASEMRGIHWQLEHRGNVYSHLILDWMHVIPLPETDDSALQEGYQLAVEEEVCGADQDRQIQHEG